jgi:hypothetical protein
MDGRQLSVRIENMERGNLLESARMLGRDDERLVMQPI